MVGTTAQQQQATGKREAIYTRVSSEAQAAEEAVSLGEQTRDIEAYASERGYSITHRYQDVESGGSRHRPGFQRLQADARAGAFDVVLAWRTDRLSRSGASMGDLLDSTKNHEIGIETVREPFDRRYAGLLAEVAAIEREAFAERSAMGKKGAARAGRIPAGRPPYGFRKAADGRPVIEEHEAVVVTRMFHLYADSRIGVPTIMRTLQAEFGFKRTTANGYLMLRNETYVGRMSYDGVAIPCTAIVDMATWERTQELLTKKTVTASRGNTKVSYALQGLVTCDGCGRLLAARTRREKNGHVLRYYRCRGYSRECRPRPYIKADLLEAKVWRHVSDLLRSPEKVVERFSNPTSDTLEEDIAAAKHDIQKWRRRSERLTGIYVQEIIDVSEYQHQRKFILEPLEAAEERLGRLTAQKERAEAAAGAGNAFVANVTKYLKALGAAPNTSEDGGPLDAQGLKAIIRDIFDRAIIDSSNRLRYSLRVPAPKAAITSSSPAWT